MDTASLLGRWESFYVIVGSSAGALTGLQFVVIALIAENQAARSMREIRAFGTPTVCISALCSLYPPS
jgi:lipid-binding SYLF domain-containing protein